MCPALPVVTPEAEEVPLPEALCVAVPEELLAEVAEALELERLEPAQPAISTNAHPWNRMRSLPPTWVTTPA